MSTYNLFIMATIIIMYTCAGVFCHKIGTPLSEILDPPLMPCSMHAAVFTNLNPDVSYSSISLLVSITLSKYNLYIVYYICMMQYNAYITNIHIIKGGGLALWAPPPSGSATASVIATSNCHTYLEDALQRIPEEGTGRAGSS